MEVDLTHGAVAAMSQLAEGLRPVLQVAGPPRPPGPATERYRILLSDSVHSQEAMLAASLNHLVTAGHLRDGSVVRVFDYFCNSVQNRRVIIVIQLEILQTECTLIGSPTFYEVNATPCNIGSYSGGPGIHGPYIISSAEQGVNNISCSPDQALLGSSIAPRVGDAVNNLPFCGSYGSMPAQNTTDSKMQQLSLNSHQYQRLEVPSTGGGFGHPGNSCGCSAQPSYQQPPVANNEAPPCVIPIAALNPNQGRWTIKAFVTGNTATIPGMVPGGEPSAIDLEDSGSSIDRAEEDKSGSKRKEGAKGKEKQKKNKYFEEYKKAARAISSQCTGSVQSPSVTIPTIKKVMELMLQCGVIQGTPLFFTACNLALKPEIRELIVAIPSNEGRLYYLQTSHDNGL